MERLSPEGTAPGAVPQGTHDPVTGSETELRDKGVVSASLGSRCPEAHSLMVLKPLSKIHPKCTKTIFFMAHEFHVSSASQED